MLESALGLLLVLTCSRSLSVDDRERFINAVFVACLETELPDFDQRECGYQRVSIDARDVEFDQTQFASSCVPSQFWIYVQSKFCAPTPEKPICLSYVDVVLAGALEFGEAFAIEFINTTGLWQHLTNDRKSPVYIRHDSSIVTISIDHLLQHVKREDQPM